MPRGWAVFLSEQLAAVRHPPIRDRQNDLPLLVRKACYKAFRDKAGYALRRQVDHRHHLATNQGCGLVMNRDLRARLPDAQLSEVDPELESRLARGGKSFGADDRAGPQLDLFKVRPLDGAQRPNYGMRVLFLCTGNTCRSQMAEAFARAFARVDVEAWSAGSRPGNRVNPYALQVMAERGADLSNHRPKSLAEVPLPVDVVVSLCASAANECPAFPGAHAVEHWGLPDPADATGTEEEVLEVFRRSRDEIEQRVTDLLDRLGLLPTRLGVASGEQETIDV